ncbi:HAD family hydrolase [Marinicellulosiphila megalodicopiae]|uniref:HAD family hydrolase n=1 Tax=Marinicellulosiphila megalodicopiae TaxID=2724896 RepID=UPI003BB1988F
MKHIMFDIDGTLIDSNEFDADCYSQAVFEVTGKQINDNWKRFKHITDSGILHQFLKEQNISDNIDKIEQQVKAIFITKIKTHLDAHPVRAISGAQGFIRHLKRQDNISLSIATGGWRETALLKLASANIDVSNMVIASSSNHYDRSEIMNIAFEKTNNPTSKIITYFGDGLWDKQACEQLGYELVLVGNTFKHPKQINNYDSIQDVLNLISID